MKNIYNQHLDKRKEIMNDTSFEVEDIFGDIISKASFSPDQTTKLNNFQRKYCEKK